MVNKATNKKFYVTTAIDYVNARPHIGHAFEKVLADAISRWKKLKGNKVWFLTGTDENAQKNAQAAKVAGVPTKKFVDKNSQLFIQLCKKLNVSYDEFIRTTEPRHIKVAQKIFKQVYDKGEIYKGKYEGYYCVGCESFITEKDLVKGKCPEHNKEPEWMSEEAYFFKLSKYKQQILNFLPRYITPESKKNEILNRIKQNELKDLCVSRKNLDWGVDSPIDPEFKIYVWFDALINYISGAEGNWPADLHIIGKGINWFHSVIWPAMLLSAGYKLPKKLLVHGYLNLRGKKISKSLGNIIDPLELAEKYHSDSIRYSLLRCSVFEDSDYSENILAERNNTELANKLGNLVARVQGLILKKGGEIKKGTNDKKLYEKLRLDKIKKSMENYELDKALNEIFNFIDKCNEYIQEKKPWQLGGKEFNQVIYSSADAIRTIAILLWPFIPATSERISDKFGFKINPGSIKDCKPGLLKGIKIKKQDILFKKINIKQ
jgi:methionyl-tRNA synthetase